MAVTFVAAGSATQSGTAASISITAPTCLADDILIACVATKTLLGATNVISPPDSSWTQIFQGNNDCTDDDTDSHQYAIFWRRATGSAGSFSFTKATDDNNTFTGIISAWRGAELFPTPLDATAAAASEEAANRNNVPFPAFDPTDTDSHIIYCAFYGEDSTAFAAAMSSDTNPDCTTRYDVEVNGDTGESDITFACT